MPAYIPALLPAAEYPELFQLPGPESPSLPFRLSLPLLCASHYPWLVPAFQDPALPADFLPDHYRHPNRSQRLHRIPIHSVRYLSDISYFRMHKSHLPCYKNTSLSMVFHLLLPSQMQEDRFPALSLHPPQNYLSGGNIPDYLPENVLDLRPLPGSVYL